MAGNNIITETKQHMDKTIKSLDADLAKVRTGRASIAILDGVHVDYYGTPTPLNQVATLATPDARMITVTPFEKKMIAAIEKALMVADLGLTPTNDGNVVRLPIPALSEERRKDLAKTIKKTGEESKVAIRNVRREANDKLKKIEKNKEISEDESRKLQDEVQKITDQFVKVVDERIARKEKEVMTV